jgi:hypothetical protein
MNCAPPLQKATSKPLLATPGNRALQRNCVCGSSTSSFTGECKECGKKKQLGSQTKLVVGAFDDPLEQEADQIAAQVTTAASHGAVSDSPMRIQRSAGQSHGQTVAAPQSAFHVLAGSGKPLEPALRQDMEQRFSYDFSRVRLHTDAAAGRSARDVNAHAYTVGPNIVFGAGRFAPDSNDGRRLLAHELTHVVQQGANTSSPATLLRDGPVSSEATEDISERLDSLLSGDENQEPLPGPVQLEAEERAREYLGVMRTILNDVHRDLNTLLNLMDGLSGFVSTDIADGTLALSILYEGLDTVAIAAPEKLEGPTAIFAKSIKVIVMAHQRRKEAKETNQRALSRVTETASLFDLLVNGQTMVDELLDQIKYDPGVADFFANQPVPAVPRRVSTGISRELELRMMVSVLRRQRAKVDTEETETITLPKADDPMNTAMNREAQRRHADQSDNFWLRRLHKRAEWSTWRAVTSWDASSGATGKTEYSWYYWVITGVSEEMITFMLNRLATIGISKDRLFTLMLGSLIKYR